MTEASKEPVKESAVPDGPAATDEDPVRREDARIIQLDRDMAPRRIRLPESPWNRSNASLAQGKPFNPRPGLVKAVLVFALFLVLLAATIVAYVIAIQRLKKGSVVQQPDGTSIEQKVSISTIIFLDALLVVALIVLVFSIWRSFVKFIRIILYPFSSPESLPSPIEATESSNESAFKMPGKWQIRLFGTPPPHAIKVPPTLPSYETALRQAARQGARRRAAELGVSAGRRGRENFGSGDPEDLEVERILRLGGLPPNYRSEEMRKSVRVLRGEKPPLERRLSIMSLFSATTEGTSVTSPTSPVYSTTGRIASVLRRWSGRSTAGSESPTPVSSRNIHFEKQEKEGLELVEAVSRTGQVNVFPKQAIKKGTGKDQVDEKDAIEEGEEDEQLHNLKSVNYMRFSGREREAVV